MGRAHFNLYSFVSALLKKKVQPKNISKISTVFFLVKLSELTNLKAHGTFYNLLQPAVFDL